MPFVYEYLYLVLVYKYQCCSSVTLRISTKFSKCLFEKSRSLLVQVPYCTIPWRNNALQADYGNSPPFDGHLSNFCCSAVHLLHERKYRTDSTKSLEEVFLVLVLVQVARPRKRWQSQFEFLPSKDRKSWYYLLAAYYAWMLHFRNILHGTLRGTR